MPLVVGAILYVVWRAEEVRLVTWLPAALVRALRSSLGAVPLPRIVVASGSDACWGFAFGAAIGSIWRGRLAERRARLWLAAGATIAAYAEIGQLWQLPPGTFDVVDLVAIAGGYALGASISAHQPRLRDPGLGGEAPAVVRER
ncbi:MAG: hypothetical protein KF837_37665 [Labilithrix sp.]|nr:hypothetical protein [Labilithrix sp.]